MEVETVLCDGFAVNTLACVITLESMGESSEQRCIFAMSQSPELTYCWISPSLPLTLTPQPAHQYRVETCPWMQIRKPVERLHWAELSLVIFNWQSRTMQKDGQLGASGDSLGSYKSDFLTSSVSIYFYH